MPSSHWPQAPWEDGSAGPPVPLEGCRAGWLRDEKAAAPLVDGSARRRQRIPAPRKGGGVGCWLDEATAASGHRPCEKTAAPSGSMARRRRRCWPLAP
ncbi:hypothetical protein E2562_009617 [Oryza meyeriana var. granulata]|uniref:Uncharacterized protein n=1 Tax=Oryza meyeriana var. granulata TaxID=110450 RepID=A0A6G1BI73_9ORYZ|nr:hypothetical protein E2562_009617 [Oryza meyeriana var. granulata]